MNSLFTRLARRRSVVGLGAALCASVCLTGTNAAELDRAARSLNFQPIAKTAIKEQQTGNVLVFVRFNTPSVSEAVLLARQSSAAGAMNGATQRAYASRIDVEHGMQSKAIEALGAKIESTMRIGANGMKVRVDASRLDELRALPGVRSVSMVETHTLALHRSVSWVGAPAVWDQVGDGSGITIAIIDSGIDYLHANMGGSGSVDDYNANDFNVIEKGTFPNAKVIGGYDFAGPVYNPSSSNTDLHVPTPDPDPLDGNGHGSHVAGIAGGLGVEGSIGSGVAPGASLYALKVFNDTAGSTNLTADAIEWALDPNQDGDMSDHVDVINMSLGSPFGSPESPSAIAASNAADMGIIVVASAGNSGTVPYVTGSPAVGPNVISVASSLTGGDVFAVKVDGSPADGLYEALEGVGAVRVSDGTVTGNLVIAEPLQACNADANGLPLGLDNDIDGGVALVQRGGCSFDLKYLNAQLSGASAILVYNDGADPSRVAPITMGGVGNLGIAVTIPGVMISSTAGDFLNASISDGHSLSAEMDEDLLTPTLFGDSMSGFSSLGPGHGGSMFKPDMTAPGSAITSTGAGSGTGSLTIGGTSMAAPHVAGAAALMRQAFPDASVAAIKAMLMNSTVDAAPDGLIGPAHSLSRMGVGVLRVDAAEQLDSFASPAGVAFGRINAARDTVRRTLVSVNNLSAESKTFSVTHVPGQTLAGVSMNVADSITVKAGQSAALSVMLMYSPEAEGSDDGSFSQSEVDGHLVLNDGEDTLRVGYFAVIDPASVVGTRSVGSAIELKNGGPGDGIAEGFTLALQGTDNGDDRTDMASVRALGYRTSVVSGSQVVEIGIDMNSGWETMSDLSFDLFLDIDSDGSDDVQLRATDWSEFDGNIGTMLTAQFDLVGGAAFLDWFVNIGDYNDTSAAFIFTRAADGGLVPDVFDFRLEVSASDGSSDTETGRIDLSEEIVAASPSILVGASQSETVETSGSTGDMLWLLQNNQVGRQSSIVHVGK